MNKLFAIEVEEETEEDGLIIDTVYVLAGSLGSAVQKWKVAVSDGINLELRAQSGRANDSVLPSQIHDPVSVMLIADDDAHIIL